MIKESKIKQEKKEWFCGSCGEVYSSPEKAKDCCKDRKDSNKRIKGSIYGKRQLDQLTNKTLKFDGD